MNNLGIRGLYDRLGEKKIEELCKNFYNTLYGLVHLASFFLHLTCFVSADEKPEHEFFVKQFKSTPLDLAIHNLLTFLVQKMGGPEYYGGMVKESSFIREMHVELFAVRQEDVQTWLTLFEEAMVKTGLDEDVKTTIRNWAIG